MENTTNTQNQKDIIEEIEKKSPAQEWLDKEYPKDGVCLGEYDKENIGKTRKEIERLNISNKNLKGKLVIQGFPSLKRIDCRGNKELISIKLSNLSQLDWFNANNCQISTLKINNCLNITYFNIANNLLTDLNSFSNLNPEKLTVLSVHTNNFSNQGLTFFSQFTNLQQLFLDNCDEERFKKGEYNKFTGSLKPLQKLEKLELLSIGNTNIDSGLEYLPASFRKIGLNTSWWEIDTGCSRLRQELERVARLKEVTEKLKSEREENSQGKKDEAWFDDYYRIAPWCQALDLLGEEGLKNVTRPNAQKWLDEKYPKEETEEIKKRKNITFLNINGRNLESELDLSDFVNLEKLDCSYNRITNLDLSKCRNLNYLNCSGNEFISPDFLSKIPCKEKLKVLRINNNEKIKESLEWLKDFVGLSTLNLESCPFYGSLEPLKKMSELKRIYISDTHISEGLEYLPDSCSEVYCDTSDYKYKSMRITKELSKFVEGSYYDVWKWREDKENSTSTKVIPLERLYVIRGNIKKFVNKWGKKEVEDNWYEWFLAKLKAKKEENKTNELSKLQSPEEFGIYRYTKSAKWVARAGAVTGGILSLSEYPEIGGVLSAASPFVEILASNVEDELYETKQKKWDEFINDTENLLDNYHELLGILEQIKKSKLGEVNQALSDLRDKVELFLITYDKPGKDGKRNGLVDLPELIDNKKEFGEDLLKEDLEKGGGSQLGDIVLAIKELEREVVNYRQGATEEILSNKGIDEKIEPLQEEDNYHQIVDLTKHFEEKEAPHQSHIQTPPKGNN